MNDKTLQVVNNYKKEQRNRRINIAINIVVAILFAILYFGILMVCIVSLPTFLGTIPMFWRIMLGFIFYAIFIFSTLLVIALLIDECKNEFEVGIFGL